MEQRGFLPDTWKFLCIAEIIVKKLCGYIKAERTIKVEAKGTYILVSKYFTVHTARA